MKRSDQINEIAAALSKAQGEMKPAAFDRTNPHFKNKYATLTSIMESIKEPMSKNGLCTVQTLATTEKGMSVVTTVLHSSGQWISDEGIPLVLDKDNMQGLGSAITYAKRYGISALLSVVSEEDDDGEGSLPGRAPTIAGVTHVEKPLITAPAHSAPSGNDTCDKCGKKMGPSKFNAGQLYCVPCKFSKTVEA